MTQQSDQKLNENGIPIFGDLPLRKGDPMLSAWGLYGPDDELGTLNRLTNPRVAAAAKSEIPTGERYGKASPFTPTGISTETRLTWLGSP
jgi:hypothetical protein